MAEQKNVPLKEALGRKANDFDPDFLKALADVSAEFDAETTVQKLEKWHGVLTRFREAITTDPDQLLPNNALYAQDKVVSFLFELVKKFDPHEKKPEEEGTFFEEVLADTQTFLDQYGRYLVKWGVPFPSEKEQIKARILKPLKDDASPHGLKYKEVLEQILFPYFDKVQLSMSDISNLSDEAKKVRATYGSYEMDDSTPNLANRRRLIDPEIGKHFQGHGIDNTSSHSIAAHATDLRNLIYLLNFGPATEGSELNTAPLRSEDSVETDIHAAIGAAHPYTEGGFIILSPYKQPLTGKNIQAVLVNPHFYHALPQLKAAFPAPETYFIKADELPEKLNELVPSEG